MDVVVKRVYEKRAMLVVDTLSDAIELFLLYPNTD
jgi:hypothetical protein